MIFCKYCKGRLENKLEIEQEYHSVCHQEVIEYQDSLDIREYGNVLLSKVEFTVLIEL